MSSNERIRRRPAQERPSADSGGADGSTESLAKEGAAFAAAANEIIARALSGNSEGFLRENKQQSGQ